MIIRHFGGLRFSSHDSHFSLPPEFPRSLFSFLSCHPGRVFCRDFLSGCLWPRLPTGRARRALSTALWRLRRSAPAARCLTAPSRDTVAFGMACRLWIDTIAFEHRVTRATALVGPAPRRALHLATRAIALYDAAAFCDLPDDWALDERTRLENLYCDALDMAARLNLDHGRFRLAGQLATQLARIEPFREDVRRLQVTASLRAGNRAEARHLFETFATFLGNELNVAPEFTLDEIAQGPQDPAPNRIATTPHLASSIPALRRALRQIDSHLAAAETQLDGNLPPRAEG